MLITRRLFCFEASLSESHLRRSLAMVKIEFCRMPAGHSSFLCFISCTIYQWSQFKSVRSIYTPGFNAVTVVNSGNTRMPVTASAQKKRKCATTERRVWSSTLFQPAFLIPIIPFSFVCWMSWTVMQVRWATGFPPLTVFSNKLTRRATRPKKGTGLHQ